MTQTIERRRHQLAFAKNAIHTVWRKTSEYPQERHHDTEAEYRADDGREEDEGDGLDPAFGFEQTGDALVSRYGCAGVAADQGVRRTRWQAVIPGDHVPDDSADEATQQHPQLPLLFDQLDVDQVAADGLCHPRAEDEKGDEVERRRPDDGDAGC